MHASRAPRGPEPFPMAGLHILWVDDHPENNTAEVGFLQSRGATVYTATDRARAQHALGITDVGVLISDVQRGTDRDAGFDVLERRRDSGAYTGPAIFYASRITPHAQARARALGAEVCVSSRELYDQVIRAWRDRG